MNKENLKAALDNLRFFLDEYCDVMMYADRGDLNSCKRFLTDVVKGKDVKNLREQIEIVASRLKTVRMAGYPETEKLLKDTIDLLTEFKGGSHLYVG